LRQLELLELLVMRAPPGLRFVLAAQHEVLSGLHQLRLEGELAEIRGPDLRFTVAEAAELFAAAGVELPDPALALLVERTEGWAAGLRLAALSLAGNPDPERFAWEFSGTERTVAEYLLADVLDRQPEPVRRRLLRTSVLERVNGELADLLTGDEGGERVLQDLADANALVVPLDAARSWFRYHQLLADLLALELRAAPRRAGRDRRTAPGRRRLVRGARAPGGCGPAGAGRPALGAGRPAAVRLLARPVPGRPERPRPRAPGRVSGRGERGGCGAGCGDRGG
jgi:LuxR family transcriptional regulator, maltose regulon positive regulatory protein